MANHLPSDLVELGIVSGAYGIRGWVRVRPYAANSQTLLEVNKWWLKVPAQIGVGAKHTVPIASGNKFVFHETTNAREHGGQIVAQFVGISDRTTAEQLKGYTVWVSRADFAATDPDEYYWVDLIGCLLYGENNNNSKLIGEVVGLMDNGAHGVLRVARISKLDQALGGTNHTYVLNKKGGVIEVLVPFVQAHVHTVDIAGRKLLSNWPVD